MSKQFRFCSECKCAVRYKDPGSRGMYYPYCPGCKKERPLSSEQWVETNFPNQEVPDDFVAAKQYDTTYTPGPELVAEKRKDGSYDFKTIEEKNKANATRASRDRVGHNASVKASYRLRPGDTLRGKGRDKDKN